MLNRKVLISTGVFLIIAIILIIRLLPDYGKTSPVGYELAQALYSACNLEDPVRIDRVKSMLDQQNDHQEIRPNEYRWLKSIIDLAKQNDWQAAKRESRKLLDAQISHSQSRPVRP